MRRQEYKTRTGLNQFMPVLPAKAHLGDIEGGWCLKCGEPVDGVEPDARKLIHEDGCNAPKVYGIEELVLMNLVR